MIWNDDWTNVMATWVSLFAAIGTVAASWAALRTLRLQTTPDVIAYIEPHRQSLANACLVIENIGFAPAFDIWTELDERALPKSEATGKIVKSFLKSNIALLAPGQRRDIYLGSFSDLSAKWKGDELKVTLMYSNAHGNRKWRISFPLEVHSFMAHISITTTTQEDRDRRAAYKAIAKLPALLQNRLTD